MADLKEHLKFKNGEIEYQKILIDKFAHSDYWSQIDEIVEDYTKVHPLEMEITVRANLQKQQQGLNKWAEGKGKSELRLGLSMPVLLLRTLEAYDPDLFTNHSKKLKFGKRFKGLCLYAG